MSQKPTATVVFQNSSIRVVAVMKVATGVRFVVETSCPDSLGNTSWQNPRTPEPHEFGKALESRLTLAERTKLGLEMPQEEKTDLPFSDEELASMVTEAASKYENLREDGYVNMGRFLAKKILGRKASKDKEVEQLKEALKVAEDRVEALANTKIDEIHGQSRHIHPTEYLSGLEPSPEMTDIKTMDIPLDPERIGFGFNQPNAPAIARDEVYIVQTGIVGGVKGIECVAASVRIALNHVYALQDPKFGPWKEIRPFYWEGAPLVGDRRMFIHMGAYSVITDEGFRECAECAAKPGSPTLCNTCLERRGTF